MESPSTRWLIVAENLAHVARLSARATSELNADVVMVASLANAMRTLSEETFDTVIVEWSLAAAEIERLASMRRDHHAIVIALGTDLPKEQVVAALRAGVCDVFEAPYDTDAILARMRDLLGVRAEEQQGRKRYEKLRAVSSRALRDRRDIRRRVDLVCRDLVGAYQQLAKKVLSLQESSVDTTGD